MMESEKNPVSNVLKKESERLRSSSGGLDSSVFNIGPKMGSYAWLNYSELTLSNPGRGTFCFEAKASNDIHVSLNEEIRRIIVNSNFGTAEGAPTYELVFGGWLNSKSVLRKCGEQKAAISKRSNPNAVISRPGEFDKYWLSIHDGLLTLGKGSIPGQNEILRWRDEAPGRPVRFIGLSSWDTPIQYKNLRIKPSVPEEPPLKLKDEADLWTNIFNKVILSDIEFRFPGGRTLKAHKSILAGSNDYFFNLFSQNNGSTKNEIFLEDISFEDFYQVLVHLYRGSTLELSSEHSSQIVERFRLSTNPIVGRPNYSRLFNQTVLSDITFSIEGEDFICHKAILARSSEPLLAMFSHSFRESSQDTIYFPDASRSSFQLLMEYLYTGSVQLSKVEDALGLGSLADRVWLPTLKNQCMEYLRNNLDNENCCEIMDFADYFSLQSLHNDSMKFIENNFESVTKTDTFLSLDASYMFEILTSDNIMVSSEEKVFETVLNWFEADPSTRYLQTMRLLSCLRYPLMEKSYLETVVKINPFFLQSAELKERVNNALLYISSEQNQPVLKEARETSIVENCFVLREDPVLDMIVKPRKGQNFTELLFSKCGDQNGVTYWLGTRGGVERWSNPHKNGSIEVTCSSPPSRYTKPELLVAQTFSRLNYTTGQPPWWQIDLKNYVLKCNYYTLHLDGAETYFRNWTLQASNDTETWFDLKVHKNDDSFTFPGQHVGWPIYGKHAFVSYRYFRVILTDPEEWEYGGKFGLSGFELYGWCRPSESAQGLRNSTM